MWVFVNHEAKIRGRGRGKRGLVLTSEALIGPERDYQKVSDRSQRRIAPKQRTWMIPNDWPIDP